MFPSDQKKLLVFGSGFLASNFSLYVKKELGWEVGVIYRNYENPLLRDMELGQIPKNLEDLSKMIKNFQPNYILIAIGSSHVPSINANVANAIDEHLISYNFILNSLVGLQLSQLAKILVIGSASEYGEFGCRPVKETHPTTPKDAYGFIKLAQCKLGMEYACSNKLPIIHVRQFNVTGIGQSKCFVIPSICFQAAEVAKTIKNSNYSSRRSYKIRAGRTNVKRDFLSVEDICKAYKFLLTKGVSGEVYNVCSGDVVSIDEIIYISSSIIGESLEVEIDEKLLRKNEVPNSTVCGDVSKLSALGWNKEKDIYSIIEEMISHYKI